MGKVIYNEVQAVEKTEKIKPLVVESVKVIEKEYIVNIPKVEYNIVSYERPNIVDVVYEKPIVVEKEYEKPVLVEKEYECPVLKEVEYELPEFEKAKKEMIELSEEVKQLVFDARNDFVNLITEFKLAALDIIKVPVVVEVPYEVKVPVFVEEIVTKPILKETEIEIIKPRFTEKNYDVVGVIKVKNANV